MKYNFGYGEVGAHYHKNGGGIVADSVDISNNVYVGAEARISGGNIYGGNIYGGRILGGTIRGGSIWGGIVKAGTILGGTIKSGTIAGGIVRGGIIKRAIIYRGHILGGYIKGCSIWGGTIKAGIICHDIYKTTDIININGFGNFSMTAVRNTEKMRYGCIELTLDKWDENHEELAKHYMPNEWKSYTDITSILVGIVRERFSGDNNNG